MLSDERFRSSHFVWQVSESTTQVPVRMSVNLSSDVIERLSGMVNKARHDATYELETRIGKLSASGFQAQVTRDHMNVLLTAMDKHASSSDPTISYTDDSWHEHEDYMFYDEEGQHVRCRTTYTDENIETSYVTKRRVACVDLMSHHYDVRVVLSKEVERNVDDLPSTAQPYMVRIKQTRNYTAKRSPFDITCAMTWSGTSRTSAEDNQSHEPVFEIECEFNHHACVTSSNYSGRSDSYIARSLLQKTVNLMMCDSNVTFQLRS